MEVVHVHAGRRTWPHHRCYHRGRLRAGMIMQDAGCSDKVPGTKLLEPHPFAKHRSPRSVQNDLLPLLHPIERHDVESQTGHNSNVRERHSHVLFTVQIEIQVPIKSYRHTLAVTKHEIPLPRTRLPSVVDAIPGRDAMDDSTGVPEKDRRTRAAVREKRGNCGQHLRGEVGGDGTNKLQREETSVNSRAITAEKRSKNGVTSVLPVTSGTPPRCATGLHHAAVMPKVKLLVPRHITVPAVIVAALNAATVSYSNKRLLSSYRHLLLHADTNRTAVLSAPTRHTIAVVHAVR